MPSSWHVHEGSCLDILPSISAQSIDAVICDPPYPCVKRSYGTWSVPEWEEMMHAIVRECRRVLKPQGSAVFVLQPNSERLGKMRPWLWDFMAWCCREWNVVQDVWWWNPATPPNAHAKREVGMMRPSVKACVWVGEPDCLRNQGDVLWAESESNAALRATARFGRIVKPSGQSMDMRKCADTAAERGGVTPFNLLPIANTNSNSSAGSHGHGAGTPLALCDWWTRYISRPGDTILDPFCGSGTVGIAAIKRGRSFIGIERIPEYAALSRKRLEDTALSL